LPGLPGLMVLLGRSWPGRGLGSLPLTPGWGRRRATLGGWPLGLILPKAPEKASMFCIQFTLGPGFRSLQGSPGQAENTPLFPFVTSGLVVSMLDLGVPFLALQWVKVFKGGANKAKVSQGLCHPSGLALIAQGGVSQDQVNGARRSNLQTIELV